MKRANAPRLVGVVHLPPLPGSPRAANTDARRGIDAIARGVRRDVVALERAGFDAVIVENFGDAPFFPGRVDSIVVAAMSRCVRVARESCDLLLGVNVLRNDALSAIAIAAACGGDFVRVNVHVGAVVADQGVIEGRAHETLRTRRAWGAEAISLWADVDVKHAAQLAPRPPRDVTHDLVTRGLVDAVLVTGRATGAPTDPDLVAEVAEASEGRPVYVASGAKPEELRPLAEAGAHGVVVGSWLRKDGRAGGPVDARRARQFARAFRTAF